MKYLNIIKRETKVMIVIVILLLMVVLGVSYALFMQVTDNTNNQVVTTGTLQVEYASTNGYITGDTYNELLPMSNDLGLQQTGYEFSVKNTGNLPVTYNVFMYINYDSYNVDKNSGLISGDLFEDLSLIKYNLQTNSDANTEINKLSEQINKDENGIKKYNIYSGNVDSNNSINTHKLRIWLDEETDTTNIGKYIYLKLEVASYISGQEEALGCKLTNDVDGDKVADIGDEITCGGTESFYVYSSDSTDIKMLAKYNLYVGGEYDASTSTYTAYGDDATGLQDVNMKGFNSLAIRKGTTIFSNDDVKGTNYSDYEGSLVQKYVREYAAKLSEKGVKASEVTLITKEEIDILANKTLDVEYINSWAPKWLYSSSYWTRSAYSENAIWFVSNSGSFSYTNYNNNSLFGVRPVVVISSYDIKESIPKLACRATECIDNDKSKDISIGDLITYDTESFYVYSNDSTNIKMLAQYNLEVGNNTNSLYPVTTETNLQSEKTLETNYGVVAFSSTSEKGTSYTDYEGSIVQNYVNIYATKLAEKGINAKEVTLLSLEELKLLGCSSDEFTCENAPEFVYSMQYWTKTKYNDTNIWCVRNNKELSYISYKSGNVSNTSTFGVRPTVYISVDEI